MAPVMCYQEWLRDETPIPQIRNPRLIALLGHYYFDWDGFPLVQGEWCCVVVEPDGPRVVSSRVPISEGCAEITRDEFVLAAERVLRAPPNTLRRAGGDQLKVK
jgi:hypothetical protein